MLRAAAGPARPRAADAGNRRQHEHGQEQESLATTERGETDREPEDERAPPRRASPEPVGDEQHRGHDHGVQALGQHLPFRRPQPGIDRGEERGDHAGAVAHHLTSDEADRRHRERVEGDFRELMRQHRRAPEPRHRCEHEDEERGVPGARTCLSSERVQEGPDEAVSLREEVGLEVEEEAVAQWQRGGCVQGVEREPDQERDDGDPRQ